MNIWLERLDVAEHKLELEPSLTSNKPFINSVQGSCIRDINETKNKKIEELLDYIKSENIKKTTLKDKLLEIKHLFNIPDSEKKNCISNLILWILVMQIDDIIFVTYSNKTIAVCKIVSSIEPYKYKSKIDNNEYIVPRRYIEILKSINMNDLKKYFPNSHHRFFGRKTIERVANKAHKQELINFI